MSKEARMARRAARRALQQREQSEADVASMGARRHRIDEDEAKELGEDLGRLAARGQQLLLTGGALLAWVAFGRALVQLGWDFMEALRD